MWSRFDDLHERANHTVEWVRIKRLSLRKSRAFPIEGRQNNRINQLANQRCLKLLAQEYGSMAHLGNRKNVKMIAPRGGNKGWVSRNSPMHRFDGGPMRCACREVSP